MIKIGGSGDFSKTLKYFTKLTTVIDERMLKKYGDEGVTALRIATPIDSRETSLSWNYRIEKQKDRIGIVFFNKNINDNVNIAIILQYGHATKNGGWVQGRDYINPALQPVFDKLAKNAWNEVVKL